MLKVRKEKGFDTFLCCRNFTSYPKDINFIFSYLDKIYNFIFRRHANAPASYFYIKPFKIKQN